MFNSFMQAFMMFFMITVAMAFEMSINQWQLLTFNPVSWQLRLLSQLIDAGLIVALQFNFYSIYFLIFLDVLLISNLYFNGVLIAIIL